MRVIDLRSDTVTKPSPGMRQAMAQAEVGDDVFEDDPTVQALEQMVASLLGFEAALYVPSGTMANQISLRLLARPGDEVICEAGAHIFNYEVGAAAALSGLQLRPVEALRGILTPEMLEPIIRADNIHHPRTSLIAIEDTHNRAGGTVYPMETISRLKELADRHRLRLYLDGARLWNAAAYLGVAPSRIAGYFDCVSVCFSKGLGAPIGSAVISSKENIDKARRIRKMLGGGMRQVGIIAAGAIYALEHNLERIADDHCRAARLAKGLVACQLFQLDPENVQTNIVVVHLKPPLRVDSFCRRLAELGVLVVPFGRQRIRAVVHLDVSDEDIETASKIMTRAAREMA